MGLRPSEFWELTYVEFKIMRSAWETEQELKWNHTSSLMSLIANVNSGKGKSFKPEDFNPYTRKYSENQGIETKEDINRVRDMINKM